MTKVPIRLIGVPLDLGAGRRGVDMGPSALRIAGISAQLSALGCKVRDSGNITVPQREAIPVGDRAVRYMGPIVDVCRKVHAQVANALEHGSTPLVLGGDHSLAVGSVSAAADAARADGERLGVIWLDAHADMNTPRTSPSGNVHGMPLAALLGDGTTELSRLGEQTPAVDREDVALIGIRAVDLEEAAKIRSFGVTSWTMRDVDEKGMGATLREALDSLLPRCTRLHVSFDMDFVDPTIAPGVGTRVRGGPSYRESHLVMEMLADTGLVRSVDIVEINPCQDHENATAQLAVELLSSLFGKRII